MPYLKVSPFAAKNVYASNSGAIYNQVVCLVIRISSVLADTSNKLARQKDCSTRTVSTNYVAPKSEAEIFNPYYDWFVSVELKVVSKSTF